MGKTPHAVRVLQEPPYADNCFPSIVGPGSTDGLMGRQTAAGLSAAALNPIGALRGVVWVIFDVFSPGT